MPAVRGLKGTLDWGLIALRGSSTSIHGPTQTHFLQAAGSSRWSFQNRPSSWSAFSCGPTRRSHMCSERGRRPSIRIRSSAELSFSTGFDCLPDRKCSVTSRHFSQTPPIRLQQTADCGFPCEETETRHTVVVRPHTIFESVWIVFVRGFHTKYRNTAVPAGFQLTVDLLECYESIKVPSSS